LGTLVAVLVFAGCEWGLAGCAGAAAATAECFGWGVAEFGLGADGSTAAALCATWGWSSLFDPNRLLTKLPTLFA